jgi:hypothetical protein
MVKKAFDINVDYNIKNNFTILIEPNVAFEYNLINTINEINVIIAKSIEDFKSLKIENLKSTFQLINNQKTNLIILTSDIWKKLNYPKKIIFIFNDKKYYLIKKE